MGIKDFFGPVASVLGGTRVGEFVDSAFNPASNKFKKQYKYQKEFAQNAIQWRVADAVAAGLHPLAALGMPVSSYSPVSVGAEGGDLQSEMSSMGADIARAMTANAPVDDVFSARYQALQLENAQLQNDKLRSEIMLNTQAGTPPSRPSQNVTGNEHVILDNAARIDAPKMTAAVGQNWFGEGLGDMIGVVNAINWFIKNNNRSTVLETIPESRSRYSRFPGGRDYR